MAEANASSPFRLEIPTNLYALMLDHACQELPAECCGLLAGTIIDGIGQVTMCLPLVNKLNAPDEFESEPKCLLAAHRTMRAAQIDILAVYHSHPTSDPIPSRKDRERNYSEEVVTLIIGLKGGTPEVRCWWLTASDYREAGWKVES
jgi:proteasome lid subunit RPN8/RPN11